MTIMVSTLGGGETKVEDEELEELVAGFRGDVLRPADAGYDANPIYNAMHDRRPALKIRPLAPPTLSTRSTSPASEICSSPCGAAGIRWPACRAAMAASSSTSPGCGR